MLLAADLAQQHAAELLAPVDVLGLVLLDQAVVVALALLVGRAVELLLGGPVPEHGALLVDDILPVRLAREDGQELGEWLGHGRRPAARALRGMLLAAAAGAAAVWWSRRRRVANKEDRGV